MPITRDSAFELLKGYRLAHNVSPTVVRMNQQTLDDIKEWGRGTPGAEEYTTLFGCRIQVTDDPTKPDMEFA